MEKWYTLSGIREEMGKVSWPKKKELSKSTSIVLVFVLFFVTYFFLTEFVLVWFMKFLGVGI